MRISEIQRQTLETSIQLRLNLDGSGIHTIQTGIGFLDHLLTHLAVHGLFDLELTAQGDSHIDPHHTIEDCALALGQAFDQALGRRAGINRMGSAYVPMDEALAFIAIDLSGRPYCVVEADWHSPTIGNVPTSLLPHFLESFAITGQLNLHARVLYGRDDHHQAEALFKALGRALESAVRLDPRRGNNVPSTKGSLK
jgi:imidazoleglycerol-phosphate dehydratase